jgi:hypothetical protein
MEKINGPKLDLIIMAGHMAMHNWDEVEKMRKSKRIWDLVGVCFAIGLLLYTCIR